MDKLYKSAVSVIIAAILMFVPSFADDSTAARFEDVPEGHWADKAVHDLRRFGITDGIGENKFGMGLEVKRSEFVAFLAKLLKWELVTPDKGSFADNTDTSRWYYPYIETAYRKGAIPEWLTEFRPDDPITREEMAVMLVNTLGYGALARKLNDLGSDFDDVANNTGYITIAKDFGIIRGTGDNKFRPNDTAKREEAAVMMMRMYERINSPITELHAFYAIRSYPQLNYIQSLDSVSFGWSRLEYDNAGDRVILNTTSAGGNDFYIPAGFSEPVDMAVKNGVSMQLMVYADNNTFVGPDDRKIPLLEYILTRPDLTKQAVLSITEQVNNTLKDGISLSFDGVVIDFEGMKGEKLRNAFNVFLNELKRELDVTGKKLYVAVHPAGKPGREYYDGYDYKTIGQIADRIILMAHDYYAKTLTDEEMKAGYAVTPLAPADDVYFALKIITDSEKGIEDREKIWLQISFDSVQWNIQNGGIVNREPYRPGYDLIYQRLLSGAEVRYFPENGNPYAEYTDVTRQIRSVIWYEDSRSVTDRIKLAKMFGIGGISLWRLGTIPDYENTVNENLYLDVWQRILNERENR